MITEYSYLGKLYLFKMQSNCCLANFRRPFEKESIRLGISSDGENFPMQSTTCLSCGFAELTNLKLLGLEGIFV